MKYKVSAVILYVFTSLNVTAQSVILNTAVDSSNLENKKIVALWRKYLQSQPDSLYDNPFWNPAEKRQYKSYDLLKSEGYISPSLYYWAKYNKNIILSITPKDNYYIIRSMFYSNIGKVNINIMAIVNVIAKKEGEEFFLYNYLPVYTVGWLNKKVGLIDYRYNQQHVFDEALANSANRFLSKLSSVFDLSILPITYYIAPNCDEIHRMKGFDYVFSMGSLRTCGFYDATNRIIYSTSHGGENNQHELIHVINTAFPKAHGLLLAGLSAYWGAENANFGKPLIYHIKRVNEHLKSNPNINLANVTEFNYMDSQTNPQYVLGAILCDQALRKGGINSLKKMLNGGTTDNELISSIETDLGIPRNKLDSFLRKRISSMSESDVFETIEFK